MPLTPGQLVDGQTPGHLDDHEEIHARLDGLSAPTVAAMVAGSYPVGVVTLTQGYHAAGDGGACFYRVIAAATESYDIAGNGIAFRPIVTGTLHPKMFGTVNDGTTLDNLPLQACYDYAADHGIAYIDGLGLTYTIGTLLPYDDPGTRGWSHTGALVNAGRTLDNFNFLTAAGSTNGTSPLAVRMLDDGKPTYVRNSTIDGNAANVAPDTANGREDGGLHGVHLWHPLTDTTAVADRDFYPCGNVYFDNVTIRNVYSYGGRPDTLDCLIELRDCTFDNEGIAFLAHSTRFVVDGGDVLVRTPRAGRVGSPFTTEIEFDDNYSGTKTMKAEFRHVNYEMEVANEGLFKVQAVPMLGLDWDIISIDDCNTATGSLLVFTTRGTNTNPTPTVVNIGRIDITRSTPGAEAVTLSAEATTAPNNATLRVGTFRYDGKSGPGYVRITGQVTVGDIQFPSATFVEEGRLITTGGTVFERFTVKDIDSPALGVSGILRDTTGTTTINELIVDGGTLAMLGSANGLFDCNVGRVTMKGLTVRPNESNQHTRLLLVRNATAEITLQDILLTGTVYRSSLFPLVYSTTMTGGFIHLRNVRHLTAPAEPALNVANLPVGRIIKESVAPLYAA